MFEFLREWVKPTAVKRQETLNAYIDGELSPQNRTAFERLLADDAALQQELADREMIKSQLQQLPRLAVPRTFILDVNKYGRPAKRPFVQSAYPILRGATVLTAVLFIFTLGLGMFSGGSADFSMAPQAEMAEMAVEEAVEEIVAEQAAEMDVETVVEEEAVEYTSADELADSSVDDMDGAVANDAAGEEVVTEQELAESEPEMEEGAEVPAAAASRMITATKTITAAETAVVPTPTLTPTSTSTPTPTATVTPTATPVPPSQPESPPSLDLSNSQIIQIGLLILFITLLILTIYAKLQSDEVTK